MLDTRLIATAGTWLAAALLAAAAPLASAQQQGKPVQGDPEYARRMAAQHQHDKPTANPNAVAEPATPVEASRVVYATVGGKPVTGYLARPKGAAGPLPGLIVVHEWWGLNDNVEAMTRRLAGEGYDALAVDLYGGRSAADPDGAKALMGEVGAHPEAAIDNLRQAYGYLDTHEKAPKIGTIGWCFGGGWSLQTALALPDEVDATVIYYGRLVTDPDSLGKLQMPILGFFGGQDKAMTPESARQFEKVMKDLGKNVEMHVYEEANHAFANPSGGNYDAAAAADSWTKTVAFFARYLKP